ncbi:MAG: carbohydrate-binding protein [Phycisphaeraceae bacterium]
MHRILLAIVFALAFNLASTRAQQPAAKEQTTAWGVIVPDLVAEAALISVKEIPKDGRLDLQGMTKLTTAAAYQFKEGQRIRRWLDIEYSTDATKVSIHLPPDMTALKEPGAQLDDIWIETPSKSQQFSHGPIVFLATQATIHGTTAKLEQTNGHDRVGFWSDVNDYVTWDYTATRPGTYELILTYAASAGSAKTASEIAITLGDQTLTATLDNTGSWYRYRTLTVGTIRMPSSGKHTLTVKGTKKIGGAVMNLKAVTLLPASEGKPIRQAEDGTVTMHARDVIIRGVKVQWEPKPEKQTVGFWVNENDSVSWEFEATTPGKYTVEILQGCGKGQGGSVVNISVGMDSNALTWNHLEFVVEDTGHFQNFKARDIGTVTILGTGKHVVLVTPSIKAKNAVMDLRQVRLIPVK